ncbi:ankyrin, partial [Cryphonectria parasitica EP155]
ETIKLTAQIFNAARDGNQEVIETAIAEKLNPNLTNENGDTLLMLAAYYGHHELVEYLISAGSDPNRLNDKHRSPLAGAVFKKWDRVIEKLLAGGADPDYGTPSATQCITMFKQEDKWRVLFEQAPGKGKAK